MEVSSEDQTRLRQMSDEVYFVAAIVVVVATHHCLVIKLVNYVAITYG